MKTLNNAVLTVLISITLTACGGGGGGGGSSSPSAPPPVENKTFTVNLESVDISRTSGGSIAVNTLDVSTDTLTYNPN